MNKNQECSPERIGRFLNAELSKPEQVELESHLDTCETCRAKLTDSTASLDLVNLADERTVTVTGKDGKPTMVEKPVRRLYYQYDAQGRATKPIVFCLPPGRRAEQLFGKNKGTWTEDPFNK